jgi:uncharacterized protein YlxP (DUF503 family)
MATLHAAALLVDLRLRDVHSLKAKRAVLKRLSRSLRETFLVAYAEVDHQDQWQRSSVGVGIVSPHASQLDLAVYNVKKFFDDADSVEVLDVGVSYLEDPQA